MIHDYMLLKNQLHSKYKAHNQLGSLYKVHIIDVIHFTTLTHNKKHFLYDFRVCQLTSQPV